MSQTQKAELRENSITAAVEDHEDKLRLAIRSRVRDQVEAEDIFQEVIAQFIETYSIGTAIDSLGAWLFTVAQNKIFDRFRKRKVQEDYRESVVSVSEKEKPAPSQPDEEWTRGWLRHEIVSALEMLPREQKEVFVKHELEGKSFEEIASETGVSVNTLLSRKRYAVIHLRTYLKEVYDALE